VNADSTAISNYMTSALGCLGRSVTVSGAVADQRYTGEGHVVDPDGSGASVTLGDTNGATSRAPNSMLDISGGKIRYAIFIANTTDGSKQITNSIFVSFVGLTVSSVSFDCETFPDGSAEPPPDMTFVAWNGSASTTIWAKYGVAPGTAPITAAHSPNFGSGNTEKSAQLIGTWPGNFLLSLRELEFDDWPATIAIDNLQITHTPCGLLGCTGIQGGPPDLLVPEPASIPLLGRGLFQLWLTRSRLLRQA